MKTSKAEQEYWVRTCEDGYDLDRTIKAAIARQLSMEAVDRKLIRKLRRLLKH